MDSNLFLDFTGLGGRKAPPEWEDKNPIRSEVFGEDRLREHATSLAHSHKLGKEAWSHRWLFRIIRSDYDDLQEAHAEVLEAIGRDEAVTPAAEWLADNFYSISQHARQVTEDLPTDYYRKLPKLAEGHLSRFPRIMAIAWAYIAHTDSRFSAATLTEFVNAYQQVSPLTLGELWATPIYLRILLIDNAARVARRTHVSMKARQAATLLAQEFGSQSKALTAARAALEGLEDHAKLSFLVQLLSAARAHHGLSTESVDALRSLYEATPFDHARGVQEEHARQTANNLTMQNIFTSLKRIAEEDWVSWVESVSEVDKRLVASQSYKLADSATRTIYRRAIEEMAFLSHKEERDVADAALALAAGDDIGISLIGARRQALEASLGVHKPIQEQLYDILHRSGVAGYAATIWVAAAIVIILGARAVANAPVPPVTLALLLLFLLAPAVEAAIAMVNFGVTQLVRPVVLPSMSFDGGIPAEHRTIVAMPVLLNSFHGIDDLLNRLEEHFLANRDPELSFALVSDWRELRFRKQGGRQFASGRRGRWHCGAEPAAPDGTVPAVPPTAAVECKRQHLDGLGAQARQAA